MFKIFKKKKQDNQTTNSKPSWEPDATEALAQALKQTPVPAALKGTVRKKLAQAAEQQATKAGRTTVTTPDLMEGLLSQMPANMRSKVEQAAKQGPEGLANLQNELKNK